MEILNSLCLKCSEIYNIKHKVVDLRIDWRKQLLHKGKLLSAHKMNFWIFFILTYMVSFTFAFQFCILMEFYHGRSLLKRCTAFTLQSNSYNASSFCHCQPSLIHWWPIFFLKEISFEIIDKLYYDLLLQNVKFVSTFSI